MFDDPLTRAQKERLHRYADVSSRVMNLSARLLLETLGEPEHLTNEEASAFVFGETEWLDQDRIKDHLEFCGACSATVAAIQELRNALAAEMEAGVSPLPDPTSVAGATLLDTSGIVTLAGNEVHLPSKQKTNRKRVEDLQALVHALCTQGIVEPTKSLLKLLTLQREFFMYIPQPATSSGTRTHDTTSSLRRAPGSASPQHILLISPKDTVIRSATPVLKWQAVPGAREYVVTLSWQKNIYEPESIPVLLVGEQTEVTLPASERLEPNRLYVWSVEAVLEDDDRVESDLVWFAVLPPAAQKQLANLERDHSDSALVLTGLYEQHGLYADAQEQIDRLKALNPENPLIETLQQRLNRARSHELTNP